MANKNTTISWLRRIDWVVQPFSWLTMAALLAAAAARKGFATALWPDWVDAWVMPVLVAAAVGYLTNNIAIWLLFKPYDRHCGFVQGVIPREKAELAVKLGVVISESLLPPQELAEQLGRVIREYLHNPALLADIRSRVNAFLQKHKSAIAGFLLPSIEQAIQQAVQRHFTPANLTALFDDVVVKWLEVEDNRQLAAAAIVQEIRTRAPQLTAAIRRQFREGTETYLRQEFPGLCSWLGADDFAARLIDHLNWDRIQQHIETRLSDEETRQTICEELAELSVKIHDHLRSRMSEEKLQAFLTEHRQKAEVFLREYIEEHLPELVDQWLRQDQVWEIIANTVLPMAQDFTLSRLQSDKGAIIRQLDLPGKIRSSIMAMDMRQVHATINSVSGQHLVAIQLLGYLLGAIAGALMALTA